MKPGTKVRVIGENGLSVAEGVYQGTGIPARDLNAKYPDVQHHAVVVENQMHYFPAPFCTLQELKQ